MVVVAFTTTARAQSTMYMHGNVLRDTARNTPPERIPIDSILYYGSRIEVYYPKYANDIVVLVESIDYRHTYVYHLSKGWLEKLPPPLNDDQYNLVRISTLTDPSTAHDKVEIVYQMRGDEETNRLFIYDVVTGEIKEEK
jgi:hypothetical protein